MRPWQPTSAMPRWQRSAKSWRREQKKAPDVPGLQAVSNKVRMPRRLPTKPAVCTNYCIV